MADECAGELGLMVSVASAMASVRASGVDTGNQVGSDAVGALRPFV